MKVKNILYGIIIVLTLLLSMSTKSSFSIFLPLEMKNYRVYYVSPDGDDRYPGTFAQPLRTFKKAVSLLEPGNILYLRGGIYHEPLFINKSGKEGSPIRFLAYPGETPVLDGENRLPLSYRGLVSIESDWIVVSGLEVGYSKYRGIDLQGKHDIVSNVFVHHSQESGIIVLGDYDTVEYSRIWRNALTNEFGEVWKSGSHNWGTGLSAARDVTDGITDYAILRGNEVWENWGEGISTYQANQITIEGNVSHDNWANNIYISDSTNILCQRNFVYMNPEGYIYRGVGGGYQGIEMGDEIYNPPSANIKIINNIAYGNHKNFFWWQGVQGGGMKNVIIANNTFVNSAKENGIDIVPGSHQNVSIENNIVQQDGILPIADIPNNLELHFSHNLWSKQPVSAASGPGDIIGDPMLAKTGQPYAPDWYRLTALSPAIDKARMLPDVITDFYSKPRGSYPDMGAIEYQTENIN